jgi:hypothetical protein
MGAYRIVERLAGLHRLDRDDTWGEWAASHALFSSLRGQLAAGPVPESLRPTAESALEAEVLSALTLESYDEARGLLATYESLVTDESRSRRLSVVRAFLDAHRGAYDDAAVRLREVAAATPNAVEAEEMGTLAAAYEARAATSQGMNVHRDRALATVDGRHTETFASLTIAPNPARGSAEARLTLGVSADVRVGVSDVLGRHIATLAEGPLASGVHLMTLAGSHLPSGPYFLHAHIEGADGRITILRQRVTFVR